MAEIRKINMEKEIIEIGKQVATLLERSNNNTGWMKSIATDVRVVKKHLNNMDMRITKSEKDIIIMQQSATLKKEYREILARNCKTKNKWNFFDALEYMPRKKFISLFGSIASAIIIFITIIINAMMEYLI